MEIPEDLLDEAFAIYEEFGPDRLIPRRERLQSVFSQLTAAEVEALLKRMEAVSKTIWRLAEQGGEIKLGEAKVRASLQAEHPFLKSRGLEKSAFLVTYFAWHEGFDS